MFDPFPTHSVPREFKEHAGCPSLSIALAAWCPKRRSRANGAPGLRRHPARLHAGLFFVLRPFNQMPGFRYRMGSGQDAGQSQILDWTDPNPIPVTTISANVRPTNRQCPPSQPATPNSLPKQHQNCGLILTPVHAYPSDPPTPTHMPCDGDCLIPFAYRMMIDVRSQSGQNPNGIPEPRACSRSTAVTAAAA